MDAIANLIRGFLKRRLYESERAQRLLWCKHALKNLRYYREQPTKLFKADEEYQAIASEKYEENKTYAVALFFQTAKPEHVEWTLQHYSMYVFATSYFTVLLLCLPLAWFTNYSFVAKAVFTALDLVALYLLIHSAIDRYLYVYENTYRHSAAFLATRRARSNHLRSDS